MRTFITVVAGILFGIGTILLWFRGFQIVNSINFDDWTSADFLVIAFASLSLFGTIKRL
jgi:hypothetical protein